MSMYIPDEELLKTQTDCPTRIFISYAHAQDEIVDMIYRGLVKRGHDVWFDKSDIKYGDDWRERITAGIESSNGVLSFLSKEAVRENGVCLDELAIAVGVKYGNIHTILLQKEEDVRPPSHLTHRQWLDMSEWQDILAQGESEFMPWFQARLAVIIRKIESPESREFVGKISTIREKLRINDLAISRQNWYLTQKFVGRSWLTKDIESWLDDPTGGTLCAVYGGPGIGKSAFAAQYAYRSPRVAASIFFEHGNEHFNSASALLKELVFQLACRLPAYRNLIYGIVTTDDSVNKLNDQELFNRLLTVPLSRFMIDGKHETLCIVVDGLDECTIDERNTAAELLGKFSAHFPKWLRILVLSRKESSVIGKLNPNKQIDMRGSDAQNMEDIRLYFEERLEKLLAEHTSRDHLLDALASHTEGVFLYAYIVSEMILDGKLSIEDTGTYPHGLNSAFSTWFTRYFPDVREYKRLYQIYLGMIAVSPEPIPVEELDVVSVRYDEAEDCYELVTKVAYKKEKSSLERLKRINSLLQYRTNIFGKQTVSFSHKYIAEWLTQADDLSNESPAGVYYCDPQNSIWAMESTWRQRLDEGVVLTEYEVLHLLTYVQKEGDSRKMLQCAQDERLQRMLNDYMVSSEFRPSFTPRHHAFARVLFVEENTHLYKAIWDITKKDDDELMYRVAQHKQARFYMQIGGNDNLSMSALLLEEVCEARARILGLGHWITLRTYGDLSSVYCWMELFDKAALVEKFIIRTRTEQQPEVDVSHAMENLVDIYIKLKRFDDALDIAERVYDTRMRLSGESDSETMKAASRLSKLYYEAGRYSESLPLDKQIMRLTIKEHGKNSLESARTINNLAMTYSMLGNYATALCLMQKVYEIRSFRLGQNHSLTLKATNRIEMFKQKIDNGE